MYSGDLFRGIAPATESWLRKNHRKHVMAAGQNLFHEGDLPARLFRIVSGRLRIWKSSPSGKVMIVDHFGRGQIPGCVASFRRVPFPATATALKETAVESWPVEEFSALLANDPVLSSNAMEIVGGRAEELLCRLHDVSTEGVEGRIARILLRRVEGQALPVKLQTSRGELAEMCATTLHTVSRVVSRWSGEGIVMGRRGYIAVLDRNALSKVANQEPVENT